MNSILRALAARWLLIVITTTACLLGGLWVSLTSAPRYHGSARVALDYIRPDPITGEVVPSKMLDAYLMSQIRMLRDQQVAGPAAEILGWMDSPDVLAAYASRPATDTRDLAAWVSGILIPRIGARMIEDSNILEISYNGESEELSRAAAEALRTAYIQSSIQARQEASRDSAEKIQASIERVRKELADLEAIQSQVESETGVALGPKGIDDASNQLRLMAKRPEAPLILQDFGAVTPSMARLAQLEATINRQSQILGPNNPELLRLKRQREVFGAQIEVEGSRGDGKTAAIVAASQASAALFESLKTRVLSTREPALRLRLLQDQINGRVEEFRQLTETLIQLRSLQATTTSSISPIGEAFAEPEPVFPNNVLIVAGTSALGFILGCILACLMELMGRRVRTLRHLETATGTAVLIEIPDLGERHQNRSRRRRSRSAAHATSEAPDLAIA
jgi:succinoglycan biosynthesis transport protein ExoP